MYFNIYLNTPGIGQTLHNVQLMQLNFTKHEQELDTRALIQLNETNKYSTFHVCNLKFMIQDDSFTNHVDVFKITYSMNQRVAHLVFTALILFITLNIPLVTYTN